MALVAQRLQVGIIVSPASASRSYVVNIRCRNRPPIVNAKHIRAQWMQIQKHSPNFAPPGIVSPRGRTATALLVLSSATGGVFLAVRAVCQFGASRKPTRLTGSRWHYFQTTQSRGSTHPRSTSGNPAISSGLDSRCSVRCKCGPVTFPVAPLRPTTSPARTTSPTSCTIA